LSKLTTLSPEPAPSVTPNQGVVDVEIAEAVSRMDAALELVRTGGESINGESRAALARIARLANTYTGSPLMRPGEIVNLEG
jgi:hypothetical protein